MSNSFEQWEVNKNDMGVSPTIVFIETFHFQGTRPKGEIPLHSAYHSYFNSTMVRLKVSLQRRQHSGFHDFNSTMVRLKAVLKNLEINYYSVI